VRRDGRSPENSEDGNQKTGNQAATNRHFLFDNLSYVGTTAPSERQVKPGNALTQEKLSCIDQRYGKRFR
jgi:hypothetical protein